MRVIEMGNLPEKEVICEYCKSSLAYTKADVVDGSEELFGEFHSYRKIKCPVCGNSITLEIDGERVIK